MSPPSLFRQILFAIAVLLLLGLGWIGVSGGVQQFPEIHTAGEGVQTFAQFGFGLLAVAAILTVYWARRFNRIVLRCWEGSLAIAGGLAPIVWDDDTSLLIGLVAGVAAFLVGWGVAAVLRAGAPALLSRDGECFAALCEPRRPSDA